MIFEPVERAAMDGLAIAEEVDVVIPVYNGAGFIAECLASIFAQTVRPRKVVVVDDGSTDETASIVGSFYTAHPELILHRLEQNRGVSAARNAGIRLCSSPFVAFVDADDIWIPEKLAFQLAVFRNGDDRLGVVHSAYFLIDEQGTPIKQAFVHAPKFRGDILHQILFEDYVLSGSASSVLVKRAVLDRVGEFDEGLYHAEDWDLWARLAAISHVDFTPEPVVGIRVHSRSAQRRQQPDKEMRFFFQRLRAYNRWEKQYREHPEFIRRLRRESYDVLLGSRCGLSQVRNFYSALKTSDLGLVRDLFSSRADLWIGLAVSAARRLLYKIVALCRKVIFRTPKEGTNAGA